MNWTQVYPNHAFARLPGGREVDVSDKRETLPDDPRYGPGRKPGFYATSSSTIGGRRVKGSVIGPYKTLENAKKKAEEKWTMRGNPAGSWKETKDPFGNKGWKSSDGMAHVLKKPKGYSLFVSGGFYGVWPSKIGAQKAYDSGLYAPGAGGLTGNPKSRKVVRRRNPLHEELLKETAEQRAARHEDNRRYRDEQDRAERERDAEREKIMGYMKKGVKRKPDRFSPMGNYISRLTGNPGKASHKGFRVEAVKLNVPGIRWKITTPTGDVYTSAGGFYDDHTGHGESAQEAAVAAGWRAVEKGTYVNGARERRGNPSRKRVIRRGRR